MLCTLLMVKPLRNVLIDTLFLTNMTPYYASTHGISIYLGSARVSKYRTLSIRDVVKLIFDRQVSYSIEYVLKLFVADLATNHPEKIQKLQK